MLCSNDELFLDGTDMWWKADFIDNWRRTSSVTGLRRSSKALPKIKLAPKEKVMVTVWWFAASVIHYSFLNPGKTITSEKYAQQISEMYQILQCLQPVLVNRAQFFSMIMSDGISHTQCLKSWTNWSLVSSAIFIWPLANQLPLHASWQLFAGKVLPQPEGCGKRFPRVSWIPKYRFLHYRNKQTYFSLAKMCWL